MHDLACVIHLHSTHSDGTGTVPEIAAAARANALDVVLLTDHDTLQARRRGEEGWHDGVLVLVGEEVSPKSENHFLAFGIDEEIDHEGLDAAGILAAVRRAGGFGFAAHPFSEGSPRFERARGMPFRALEELDGLELWSFVTDSAEKIGSIRDGIRFVLRPDRWVDHPPERNMREWDRLCERKAVVAIGGLDAHQIGKRIGGRVLKLMSYERSFSFLRTHVLSREALTGELEHDREQVYDALRSGRCYLAMDRLAPAHGFTFEAEAGCMGEEIEAGWTELTARTPRPCSMRLLCGGEEIAAVEGPRLAAEVEEPGVYRIEARLEGRTWILSNPIYLR
ncbi:MAG: CehA/McbA family metallohydrolase [Thermoleophilaceae bacterium]|nr:CehA/McbA family metallohydrolase [Thermoleophilaceae bacterium]